MFEPFNFSREQIEKYYQAALHDFKIAKDSRIPEIIFNFSYNGLIKLAIAFCAKNKLRVKSQQGHHIELIRKLAEFLNDIDIELIGNEMRQKRNRDLYEGGIIITDKQAREYLDYILKIVTLAEKFIK
jgi:hypothetical protein